MSRQTHRSLALAVLIGVALLGGSRQARAEVERHFRVVSAAEEVQTSSSIFRQLQPYLPLSRDASSGFAGGTQGAYERALRSLDEGRVAEARLTFERLYRIIPFEELELLARARALASFANGVGAVRRADLALHSGERATLIAHGLFVGTYYDTRSRRELFEYASAQCVERGFVAADPLEDIPCSFPEQDVVSCKATFRCSQAGG